jgi:cell fate (sporulation/competence/biofilm development) regulator YlbF (YheA/YmcA/DUF963 family)
MNILQQTQETPVIQKTRELCQTILDQPGYQEMRRAIQDFLGHGESVAQYQRLCDKQDVLNEKQEQGLNLTDAEISEFEKEEELFLSNPVAAGFVEAQRQMQNIEKTITQLVRKTFELNRLPEASDLKSGGCGCGSGSCGC